MRLGRSTYPTLAALTLAAAAGASPDVRVIVTGSVGSNGFTTGTYAGIPSGAPVTMTIDLDSADYLDSPSLPGRTRGYRFSASTFSITVGTVTRSLRTTPPSPAYFVVRNDDPRAAATCCGKSVTNCCRAWIQPALCLRTFSSKFSRSMTSNTASPAAQASGVPPKVVPCMPG